MLSSNNTVSMHLPRGTSLESLNVIGARRILMDVGMSVKLIAENHPGNLAGSGQIVSVLPGGTKLHGVGDLRTRASQALAEEKLRAQVHEAAMTGQKQPLRLQPQTAAV